MKQQETMTNKIVKKFNNALEVIPRALSLEGGKSSHSRSRSKSSHSGRSKASSRRSPSTTAKRAASTGMTAARKGAAKAKRKLTSASSKKSAARGVARGGKRRSVKQIRSRKSSGRSRSVEARAA